MIGKTLKLGHGPVGISCSLPSSVNQVFYVQLTE